MQSSSIYNYQSSSTIIRHLSSINVINL